MITINPEKAAAIDARLAEPVFDAEKEARAMKAALLAKGVITKADIDAQKADAIAVESVRR